MTKVQLRRNVFGVIISLLVVFFTAVFLRDALHSVGGYNTIKDFSSLFIAISAAYLAFCFQRRQVFLASLKDLWKEMVDTKADLFDYTHNPHPDQAAFGSAHRSLMRTIDLVRGVYINVGESESDVGLYSFEPLHDMRKLLDDLGFSDASPERRYKARQRMLQAWYSLRFAFLKEFSRPSPVHPITEPWSRDGRRPEKIAPLESSNGPATRSGARMTP